MGGLKERIQNLQISIAYISTLIGVDKSTLSRQLTGERYISNDQVQMLESIVLDYEILHMKYKEFYSM